MTRFTLLTGVGGDVWVSAAHQVADELAISLEAVVIGPGREVTDLYDDWTGCARSTSPERCSSAPTSTSVGAQ